MPVTIDKFEYATDALARAAWVAEGTDLATSGTATASLETKPASNAFDNNPATFWQKNGGGTGWIKYDFGVGNSFAADGFSLKNTANYLSYSMKDFTFQGSNDDLGWTTLYTKTGYFPSGGVDYFLLSERSGTYRYYRWNITAVNDANTLICEAEILRLDIAVYSESTIKDQGSYSLKLVAPQTTSLNKTLTRTCSPTLNFTDQDEIKFKIRSSRTGTNLKIGFHDSGGTTTESNIAISSADTWEEKTIDISAVANANKDAIDLITITVTNADAENTIYLDEMLGYVTDEGTGGGGGITNAINVSILTPSGWQKGI